MNKVKVFILAAVVVFAASGCTPEIIRAGAERDMALYSSKIAMEATRLNVPACKIVAQPGKEIVISGASEFSCYGGSSGDGNQITQRISPIWNFLSQNSGILGMLGFSTLMFPNGLNPAPSIVQPEVIQIPTQVIEPVIVRP
jgi:hypothetical protein